MSSFYIKHLTGMFCNEFCAIASFILFTVESKIYFAFFKLESIFFLKVIDVRCFCFIFTFSIYRKINNNIIPPKKK